MSLDGCSLRTSWTFDVRTNVIWSYMNSSCAPRTASGSSEVDIETKYKQFRKNQTIRRFLAEIHTIRSSVLSTMETIAWINPNVVERLCSSPCLENIGFPDDDKIKMCFISKSQLLSDVDTSTSGVSAWLLAEISVLHFIPSRPVAIEQPISA